jgi:hypothetical protein
VHSDSQWLLSWTHELYLIHEIMISDTSTFLLFLDEFLVCWVLWIIAWHNLLAYCGRIRRAIVLPSCYSRFYIRLTFQVLCSGYYFTTVFNQDLGVLLRLNIFFLDFLILFKLMFYMCCLMLFKFQLISVVCFTLRVFLLVLKGFKTTIVWSKIFKFSVVICLITILFDDGSCCCFHGHSPSLFWAQFITFGVLAL